MYTNKLTKKLKISATDGCAEDQAGQTQERPGNSNPNIWLKLPSPARPRILIVNDDKAISGELEVILLHAGLVSECVNSMKAGCEAARTGQYQVIFTNPVLSDGSWKRLVDIDSHNRPGFVTILVASNFDLHDWGQELEEGAFDVLDAMHEMPNVADTANRAFWAAYLKGAGPRPEAAVPVRVA